MDFILQQWTHLQELSKHNPIIAGAVSLWGLGVLTWICRHVPSQIYSFFKRQLTTTLSFTNTQQGTNSETFSNFLMWFEKSKWVKWSRSISLNGNHYGNFGNDENLGTVVGIGDGDHFFFYKGRPFWMHRSRITQGGSMYNVTYEISITTLGRNRQIILDLVDEFIYKVPKDKIGIHKFENKEWIRVVDVMPRPLKTVIINRTLKDKIVADIEKFKRSRDWYAKRGLSYKLVILLHGLPGSGKSSFIKALASHFNNGLALMNLSYMSDGMFETALSSCKPNNFVLIEDFDSAESTASRTALVKRIEKEKESVASVGSEAPTLVSVNNGAHDMSFLTLSGILNALDGVVSLDGTIVFMTTNVLETIDPALLRAGRVDHIYELGALQNAEVRDYIELMFPNEYRDEKTVFKDIMGCDLQKLYFEHRDSVTNFVASIPQYPSHIRLVSHVHEEPHNFPLPEPGSSTQSA